MANGSKCVHSTNNEHIVWTDTDMEMAPEDLLLEFHVAARPNLVMHAAVVLLIAGPPA